MGRGWAAAAALFGHDIEPPAQGGYSNELYRPDNTPKVFAVGYRDV